MVVIYGWTYAQFQSNVGWEKGGETEYDFWENYYATKINSYIFPTAGTLLTDAAEILEIQTLVNKMMVLMNLYLKGEHNETPIQNGFYAIGVPDFVGFPEDNKEICSGDYVVLNKYKRRYDKPYARSDSIRIRVDHANLNFRRGVYF